MLYLRANNKWKIYSELPNMKYIIYSKLEYHF